VTSPAEAKAAVAAEVPDSGQSFGLWLSRIIRSDPAVFGMPALLVAALAITVFIHPTFSDFDLESLAMGALPLAFAAAAQALVVISGGIDLSIGSMIAVANVLAARTMENASFGDSLLLAAMVLLAGVAMGAVNGLLVVFSRVPDVVATLTTGFIWGGVALLILEKPGGGAPPEFLNLGAGTTFSTWLPNGLILLAVSVALIWTPLVRSKLGLCLYAIGSDRNAAFRSGVGVERARFASYVFSGLFSAVGGLALTMTTGIGAPLAGVYYTLSGLAAVVVGGVSLAGGRGGVVGPVFAAFVLTLIPADLIFLNIDPNFGQFIQGVLIVAIVMFSGLPALMADSVMTGAPRLASPSGSGSGTGSILSLLRRHTILALLLILVGFVLAIQFARPGTVNATWLSNMVMFAAPLGIMAAGQTLVMLTGGIDLSVASVATAAAYAMATHSSLGGAAAILYGLGVGVVVGLLNGVGIALLRVQPLVMTLGTGLMTVGMLVVYSQKMMAAGPHVPDFINALGAGKMFGTVPYSLFFWTPIALAIILALRRTGYGRLLYAIGDNRDGCELSGIRVWRVVLITYLVCGVFAAVAGLIIVGAVDAANLSLADAYLLPSVAAVIIGGTSIFGGRGGYAGTIIGAFILTVLNSILTLLDVPEPVRQILYGAIILLLAAAYTRLTE
jgi:ribose transport system permease protein